MSQKKFASMIKEAEGGVFYSLEESKKHFQEWKSQRNK